MCVTLFRNDDANIQKKLRENLVIIELSSIFAIRNARQTQNNVLVMAL